MSSPIKILLLYAHPEPKNSRANSILLQETPTLKHVTVHDLYAHYPDFFIDLYYEQELLKEHQVIVFQHPLYTYSCPALLKEWLDRVLVRGFANGIKGQFVAGKYWRSVITTGEPKHMYEKSEHHSMSAILRPFELTAAICHMHWIPPFIVYRARGQKKKVMEKYAENYTAWLKSPLAGENE